MIKEIAASVALGTISASAGLPPAAEYKPEAHSSEYVATISNGVKTVQVDMHIFGREDVLSAQLAGQSLTRSYPSHSSQSEMIEFVTEKAIRRFGNNPEAIKLYVNEARVAYLKRMDQLNLKSGMRIQ